LSLSRAAIPGVSGSNNQGFFNRGVTIGSRNAATSSAASAAGAAASAAQSPVVGRRDLNH